MTQTLPHPAHQHHESATISLSRVLELESENRRLHLLVSELLIKNQQLREAQLSFDPD